MAEDQNQDSQQEVIDVNSQGGNRRLVIVLLVFAVLVMILTPLITIYAVKITRGNPSVNEDEVTENAEENKENVEVTLPQIQTNVGAQGQKFIRMKIAMTLSEPKMEDLFKKSGENNARSKLRRVQAVVINTVSGKEVQELATPEGKQELAKELKGAINQVIAEDTSGMVTNLYFYGFMIQ